MRKLSVQWGIYRCVPLFSLIFMVKLDRLAKVIIRVNLFVLAALVTALITPFSLNIYPSSYIRLTFSLLVLCSIILVILAPRQSRTERNNQLIDKFSTGLMTSAISVACSLLALPFLPPFSPITAFLFPSILIQPAFIGQLMFSNSSAYNSTRSITSPSRRKSVKLVCFSIGLLDPATGGYLYKEWSIVQQKIAHPELADNGDNCPTDESQAFIWSDDESYLNWNEYNRYNKSTVRKRVRVY
jgi:hypothetical protein